LARKGILQAPPRNPRNAHRVTAAAHAFGELGGPPLHKGLAFVQQDYLVAALGFIQVRGR
jgi:hypothetical protein